MKITLDQSDLSAALDTVTKTAPPSSGNITVTSAKGKLQLLSVSDLSSCTVLVPCSVDKEGEFAIPLSALRDAIKGRSKITMKLSNSVLAVTAGSYTAALATVDVIPQDSSQPEVISEWKISAEQANWLRQAAKKVALKPTALLSTWIPVGIKLTNKGAFICCYDTQHMSWTHSKEVTGDFECVLPLDVFTPVVEVFHKTNFVFIQNKSSITVRNKTSKVTLSMPSMDDLPTLDQVRAKIGEASKIEGQTFKVAKEEVLGFLDNTKAVLGKERAELLVKAGKGGVELTVKTSQGQVHNTIKGSGKGEFKVDLEFFTELLSKAQDDINLNVVESAFLSSKTKDVSAIVALNQ